MKRGKGYQAMAVAAAALLAASPAGLKGAAAYFTTYVSAGGSQVVHLGAQTELQEDVSDMTKHISVVNTSQDNDCFVRVKVFAASQFEISYRDRSENGNLWSFSQEDGYWYYGPVLGPGESTQILDAKIGDLPADFAQDSFNVVVIQECTPVIYDGDGNPAADWNLVYRDYQEGEEPGEGADGQ